MNGSGCGNLLEKTINEICIDDEYQTSSGNLTNTDLDHFIGEIIVDTAFAGLDAGVISGLGKTASRKVVGESLKQVGGGGIKRYAKKWAVETVVSAPLHVGKSEVKSEIRKL